MEKESIKPFRVSLKIAPGKPIHLYVKQLGKLMENDTSLHPMMERTLKLLKKTRTPFIKLSMLREVVIDPVNKRHFDRSADPIGAWICTLWSDEEIEDYDKNPDEYIKQILKFFEAIGYELYDSVIIKEDYIKSLEELCSKQIEAQMDQRYS